MVHVGQAATEASTTATGSTITTGSGVGSNLGHVVSFDVQVQECLKELRLR